MAFCHAVPAALSRRDARRPAAPLGKALTSPDFSRRLPKRRDGGRRRPRAPRRFAFAILPRRRARFCHGDGRGWRNRSPTGETRVLRPAASWRGRKPGRRRRVRPPRARRRRIGPRTISQKNMQKRLLSRRPARPVTPGRPACAANLRQVLVCASPRRRPRPSDGEDGRRKRIVEWRVFRILPRPRGASVTATAKTAAARRMGVSQIAANPRPRT